MKILCNVSQIIIIYGNSNVCFHNLTKNSQDYTHLNMYLNNSYKVLVYNYFIQSQEYHMHYNLNVKQKFITLFHIYVFLFV